MQVGLVHVNMLQSAPATYLRNNSMVTTTSVVRATSTDQPAPTNVTPDMNCHRPHSTRRSNVSSIWRRMASRHQWNGTLSQPLVDVSSAYCTTSCNTFRYKLVKGVRCEIKCSLSTDWSLCYSAKSCDDPPTQKHGHQHETGCPQPYVFGSLCQFECDVGYELTPGGDSQIECAAKMVGESENVNWEKPPADCRGILR